MSNYAFKQRVEFNGGVEFNEDVTFGVAPTGPGTSEGASAFPVSGTATALTEIVENNLPLRHITVTLNNVVVPVLEANGYGSMVLLPLADGELISVLAVVMDLQFVADGVGYDDNSSITVGIGQDPASANPLALTMQDIYPVEGIAGMTSLVASTFYAFIMAPQLDIGETSSSAIYLNFAGATNVGENATLTLSGRVSLTLQSYGTIGAAVPK